MTFLGGKAKKAANWLSTQVEYGVDTSDADPKNWKPFGRVVESQAAAQAKKPPAPNNKSE